MAKISARTVNALKPGDRIADSEIRGFLVRRLDSGTASYAYRYRVKGTNQQRLITLGIHGQITPEEARKLAKKRAGDVADGKDPKGEREDSRTEAKRERLEAENTVNTLLDAFENDHVTGLRSGDQIKRAFTVYVRPRIGEKPIYGEDRIKRSDIAKMLLEIKTDHGPVMADRVLAHVRKAFSWQMTQDDEFSSPIVRGMAKSNPKQRARKRILTDDEIRDVWMALAEMERAPLVAGKRPNACYPAYVRNLFLTMTRRNESSDMRTSELEGDLWTIPGERYKRLPGQDNIDHVIPLSVMAQENLKTAPKPAKGVNDYFLFSTTTVNRPLGKVAFSGFSKPKAELDRLIAKVRKAAGKPKMPPWRLHDIRRTGRTLMSRAGVPDDHAERAMGHIIPGVRGVYDRHDYLEEKRGAFEALARLVALILNPPADNVVQLVGVKK